MDFDQVECGNGFSSFGQFEFSLKFLLVHMCIYIIPPPHVLLLLLLFL